MSILTRTWKRRLEITIVLFLLGAWINTISFAYYLLDSEGYQLSFFSFVGGGIQLFSMILGVIFVSPPAAGSTQEDEDMERQKQLLTESELAEERS